MFHPNHLKYLKAPSWEQIRKVVDAHQVGDKQFERFYGMAENTLNKTRIGDRQLPVRYWHIVYECLRMIDDEKPMPLYKDEQPVAPESNLFSRSITFFKSPKKKKSSKKKTIKRTGSLCELC